MPYSPDISVLTKEGWKPAPLITTEDDIAEVDVSTGSQRWVKPKKIISFPYEGDAFKFNHMTVETLVPFWKGIVSKFSKSDIFEKSNIADFVSKRIASPELGVQEDGFDVPHAYLIGWRASTSAIHKKYGKDVTFLKKDGSRLDALVAYLDKKNVSYYITPEKVNHQVVVRITGDDGRYLKEMSPNKLIPRDFLSWSLKSRRELFEGLTDAVEYEDLGDGSQNFMWTKEERRRDDMMALMSSIGIQSFSGKFGSGVLWVRYKRQTAETPQPFSKETVPYKGEMWTMETETGNWVAKRKGKVFVATT